MTDGYSEATLLEFFNDFRLTGIDEETAKWFAKERGRLRVVIFGRTATITPLGAANWTRFPLLYVSSQVRYARTHGN